MKYTYTPAGFESSLEAMNAIANVERGEYFTKDGNELVVLICPESAEIVDLSGNQISCHNIFTRTETKTIKIGDREVPAPMSEKPSVGDKYYAPRVYDTANPIRMRWRGDAIDKTYFETGIWPSEEDAIVVSEAIVESLKGNR